MSSDYFEVPKKAVYFTGGIFAVALTVFLLSFFYPSHKIDDQAVIGENRQPAAAQLPAPAVGSTLPGQELQGFFCDDLYGMLCGSPNKKDPSGRVPANYEGEAEVLRIFERLIRQNPQKSAAEIDELLAEKIYTPERTKMIRDLFENIRESMIDFFANEDLITPEHLATLKQILDSVILELPPPASVYADEPDLLTLDNAFYYHTKDGQHKIRIGGAQIYGITSRYNLAFTLAHELAHAVGPCQVGALGFQIPSYDSLLLCLDIPPEKLAVNCGPNSNFSEVFSDWVATQIVADIVEDDQKKYSARETRNAIFNAMRDICPDDPEDDPVELNVTDLTSRHPTAKFRINGIFGKSPVIQKLLGCQPRPQINEMGIPTRCFQRR